ncbi:MAG: hypothetical protein LBH97_06230 [Treponema sp.]|jgi:hypothetical protein|nr:hypothetical protein [Treponema sp.]
MKKLIAMTIFAAFLIVGIPVFAQSFPSEYESEFFYVNVSVEKVSPYRAGYVIQYRKGVTGQIAYVYLPGEWFDAAAGKGEVITLPSGTAWPSLSVYYRNGEFSHVKLYVHRWRGHETWGNIRQTVNIDDRFENIETIRLQF